LLCEFLHFAKLWNRQQNKNYVMKLRTEYGDISIVNEPTHTFASSDNVRTYPFSRNLDPDCRPVAVHGVLLDSEPLALFGASGGATGINDHSALILEGMLYLAVADKVVCMRLKPFEFRWALRVDTATCFGIYYHEHTGALLSHGELEITRFNEMGTIIWQSSGADIFTGEFSFGGDLVRVVDFNGNLHHFRLIDGNPKI
jgi:hypothetical protein